MKRDSDGRVDFEGSGFKTVEKPSHKWFHVSPAGIPGHAARGVKCLYRFCEECHPEEKDGEVQQQE